MHWGLPGLVFAGFRVILRFSWFRFGFMAPYLEVRYTSLEPLDNISNQVVRRMATVNFPRYSWICCTAAPGAGLSRVERMMPQAPWK